jgi:hypothetical protein
MVASPETFSAQCKKDHQTACDSDQVILSDAQPTRLTRVQAPETKRFFLWKRFRQKREIMGSTY